MRYYFQDNYSIIYIFCILELFLTFSTIDFFNLDLYCFLRSFQFGEYTYCMRSIKCRAVRSFSFLAFILFSYCSLWKQLLPAEWMAWIIIHGRVRTDRELVIKIFRGPTVLPSALLKTSLATRPWHTTVSRVSRLRANCFSLIRGTGR